jgi:nucleoside-diphosphate-sugar epimerase
MSQMNTVLIAGASGVVGRAALETFSAAPGWRAVGLSRRAPDTSHGEHVELDLTDPAACARVTAAYPETTHVVYAALYEKPGLIAGWREPDQMQTNLDMLRNLLEPLQLTAPGLRHVSLLQGTKAYGAHVRPMRVPGKEREPRVEHDNFYWLQEDWLTAQQATAAWTYTIWRPPVILGHALGAPMNLIAVIGVCASLAKATGEAFGWPGGPGVPMDVVDANVLARAMLWATGTGAAINETFNISNGDVLRWENAWSTVAGHFGLPTADPVPQSVAAYLEASEERWRELAATHGLAVADLQALLGDSTIYADVIWNTAGSTPPPSTLLSTIKLRQAGFGECIDSEDVILNWLKLLQKKRILPH